MQKNLLFNSDMGDPISFEDAISIMTVIFVLFFLFIIPMVNIEKARTVDASIDPFWNKLAGWLLSNPKNSNLSEQYRSALDLYGLQVRISNVPMEKTRYIEVASGDSSITAVSHNLTDNSFISMIVQAEGGVILFRKGQLVWSPGEQAWFTEKENILLGNNFMSRQFHEKYRKWIKKSRGF